MNATEDDTHCQLGSPDKKESQEIIEEVNEKRGRVEEVPMLRKGVTKALKMRR